MNKLILKIELVSNLSADITLIYVDSVVLAQDKKNFISYYDIDENFIIYSTNNDNMNFTEHALKLPSLNRYTPNQKLNIYFKKEKDLELWLKRFYRTLHKWNYKSPEFKDSINNGGLKPNRVNISNDFWIL